MTEIVKGARVRVTYEGVLVDPRETAFMHEDVYQVEPDGVSGIYAFVPKTSIEVLAPPKPTYETGAIYRGNNGCDYIRVKGGWRQVTRSHLWGFTAEERYEGCTFIKLVPEVTP